MTRLLRGIGVSTLLLPLCFSQPRPDSNQLPVKRVVLYKNGVGYFEHLGRVRDRQEVNIPFTSGQLNDVLKSLTVLDLGGGRITGVGYGSATPVDRQLGDLHLPMGEKSSLTELLGALRGARLEIKSGGSTITGRLLSIERKTRMGGGATLEVDYLSLLTENGDLRTTELGPGFSVRLLDAGLAGRVDRFLDIVSAGRQADVRRMVVTTEGTGERNLFVSYISEVPVWKSTYRIMLNSKTGQGPLLQGWAIVDNTVGQDWENVQLSLVAGAPQSFVQNLSQPYYSRRPVVPMPESAAVSPQTYQATLIAGGARLVGRITDPTGSGLPGARVKVLDSNGNLIAEAASDALGSYEFSSLPEGKMRLEVVSPGFKTKIIDGITTSAGAALQQDTRLDIGSVSESVTVTASVPMLNTSMASSMRTGSRNTGSGGMLGGTGTSSGTGRGVRDSFAGANGISEAIADTVPAAFAGELGDLFEYKLKEPITIQKNRSAMVPIVQCGIGAEKVSIWNDRTSRRPIRALWLTNTSTLTLDGGSFSVFEDETFSGEGIIEPIHPAEKRLISYAADLALNASSRNSAEAQRVTQVLVAHGIMSHRSEMRETKTYTFRNEDTSPRTVIVEHAVRAGYSLRGDVKPAEITAGWMRFRIRVEPKQSAALVVEEVHPLVATYQLTDITTPQVEAFIQQRSIDKTVEEALQRLLARKTEIAELEERKGTRDEEMTKIFDDQQRLRENMKSLKGSTEEKQLLQRYTQQLNEQENRLEKIREEIQRLERQKEAAEAELGKMIQSLSFDVRV